jgi:hypothetical protein
LANRPAPKARSGLSFLNRGPQETEFRPWALPFGLVRVDQEITSPHKTRRTFMKSNSLAVVEQLAIVSSSKEGPPDSMPKLMVLNNVKLEVFTVIVAWAFASVILLLMVVSLLLVVAGYAGSTFAPDLGPKTVSSSWGR